jgi:hypothetical protein
VLDGTDTALKIADTNMKKNPASRISTSYFKQGTLGCIYRCKDEYHYE